MLELVLFVLAVGLGFLIGLRDREDWKHRAERAEDDYFAELDECIELRHTVEKLENKIAKQTRRAEQRGEKTTYLWEERANLRGALIALLEEHINWAKQQSYSEEAIESMPQVAFARKVLWGE